MAERIIAALSATLGDGSEVEQGQKVNLSAEDEARLEDQRALVPTSFDSFQSYSDFKLDAYRAGRGDVQAAGRLAEARAGGIEDLSAPAGNDHVEWLRSQNPTIDATVERAEGDPAKAQAILDAEHTATGGEPRKGVVEGLQKVIGE